MDPSADPTTLSEEEISQIRSNYKLTLNTQLSTAWPITKTVPEGIPPNVPADQLTVPETIITVLDNGVRVVSQETYGQVSTVGVLSEFGSRLELPYEMGVCSVYEALGLGATKELSGVQITSLIQDWGGQRLMASGREQTLYCIDLLRPNVDKALALLQKVILEPQFDPEEIDNAKRALAFQAMDMPPEFRLTEAIQEAAYGLDQQLGKPHYCPEDFLSRLTSDTLRDFWVRQFLNNPKGMVVAGAGVCHDHLVKKSEELFGHLKQNDTNRTMVVPSLYRGGEQRVVQQTTDGLIRVMIGLEVGGWHSDNFVATCVLQTLLGGGSSFSAGGPGKGMYSRLYRKVLNLYNWAESAEAFTSFNGESGLYGIVGSTRPENARDMIHVFTEHLAKLAIDLVSDEEFDRARNMLKCNVLTQLESRLVLFEDMGRQVLTYGHREGMHATCERIDAVTKHDLRNVAIKALQKPPCLACVGDNVVHMPHQDEVIRWLS